jgi:hypothetical protein
MVNWAGAVNGLLASSFWLIIVLFGLGVVCWGGWWFYQKKNVYYYNVYLEKMRANGSMQTIGPLPAGMIKRRGTGVNDFRVKTGPFKRHDVGEVPDPRYITENNTVYYIQIGDGRIWQQAHKVIQETQLIKRERVLTDDEKKRFEELKIIHEQKGLDKEQEKELEELLYEEAEQRLLMIPIPTDVKHRTINDIQAVRNLFDRNKVTVYAIGIFAFVITLIAQIVFLFFTTKK